MVTKSHTATLEFEHEDQFWGQGDTMHRKKSSFYESICMYGGKCRGGIFLAEKRYIHTIRLEKFQPYVCQVYIENVHTGDTMGAGCLWCSMPVTSPVCKPNMIFNLEKYIFKIG